MLQEDPDKYLQSINPCRSWHTDQPPKGECYTTHCSPLHLHQCSLTIVIVYKISFHIYIILHFLVILLRVILFQMRLWLFSFLNISSFKLSFFFHLHTCILSVSFLFICLPSSFVKRKNLLLFFHQENIREHNSKRKHTS